MKLQPLLLSQLRDGRPGRGSAFIKAGAAVPGRDPRSLELPCFRCMRTGEGLAKAGLISSLAQRQEGFVAIMRLEIGKSLTDHVLSLNLIRQAS